MHKNLPAGTLIEISGEVNVSGVFTASCFVEALDEHFDATDAIMEFNADKFLAHLNRIHAQVEAVGSEGRAGR